MKGDRAYIGSMIQFSSEPHPTFDALPNEPRDAQVLVSESGFQVAGERSHRMEDFDDLV